MKNTKKCNGCVWFDQCGHEFACDAYCAASIDEEYADLMAEYENDLRDRHEYYQELIDELN